jgi:hypothetical protein
MYSVLFIFFLSSCTISDKKEIDAVFLCALDKLMADYEFRDYLIGGSNYIAWVPDGYMVKDSVKTENGRIAWNTLKHIEVDKSFINGLNIRFPEGHKLNLVSQHENEDLLRNNSHQRFSSWFFGGLKKHNNRYYLNGGFAVTPKAGIGAFFIIEVENGKCNVLEYAPAIM